jgi:hypothetical protein
MLADAETVDGQGDGGERLRRVETNGAGDSDTVDRHFDVPVEDGSGGGDFGERDHGGGRRRARVEATADREGTP